MNIHEEFRKLKEGSSDQFLLHDILLPVSPDCLFQVMRQPENWAIVNFPTISKVEQLHNIEDAIETQSTLYVLKEKLLGKYYTSKIDFCVYDESKRIEYSHIKPSFPFVDKMGSFWYFVPGGNDWVHFYIIRQFHIKSLFARILLFPFLKYIINRHVMHYQDQLINLFKTLAISNLIQNAYEK